ncbi:MAG: MFS transporter [Ignavibacteriales bacterium]|nr:MFS transporter [Ignavibacteriales bacterium]
MTEAATAPPVGFFHPTRPIYRFVNLLFISSLTFGSYFAYDIIGAIAPSLIEGLNASRATVGAFNTMYSVAAILVLLFAGVLIDRLGTRKSSIIFSVLVLAGAVLVWQARSIPLMFVGRFIFGAGAEPLVVAQSAMLARWFKNKELALSFGVALTVSRLGSLFALNNGELITKYLRQLPQRPPGRGRRLRPVARREPLLHPHGQARREGPPPPRRERRRQDRLQGRQGVQADLLVRHGPLLHLLRGHLPLPEPVDGLLPHQVGDRPGGRVGGQLPGPGLQQLPPHLRHGGRRHQHHHLLLDDPGPVRRAPHRPGGEADDLHDRRLASPHPLPPGHGPDEDLSGLPDDPPRLRLRPGPGGAVAVRAAHRQIQPGGDGLRPDDGHPEHRPGALPASQRHAQGQDGRLRRQPGHVRQPGSRRLDVRAPPQAGRPSGGRGARSAAEGQGLKAGEKANPGGTPPPTEAGPSGLSSAKSASRQGFLATSALLFRLMSAAWARL